MAHLNKYGLKQFDGTGFANWEFRIKGVLEEQGVLEMVLGNCTDLGSKKNKEKEALAKNIIIQSITDDCLEIVKSFDSSKEMLNALKNNFQRNSLSERVHLKKELSNMKFDGKSSMSNFILKFESLIRRIRDSGCEIDENEKITSFLTTLPRNYENFCTSLDLLISQKSLKFDFVRTRILDEELKKKSSVPSSVNVKQESNVSAFSTFKYQCYNCGKMGHKRSECRVKKKTWNSSGNYNHSSKPVKPKANLAAELEETVNTDVSSTHNLDSISFLSCLDERSADALNAVVDSSIEFIVDSGASDHFINDEKYFNGQYIDLRTPISVSVAKDGQKMVATKLGTIITESFTIKNVLFVKDLKANLLSVRKIEQAGLSVTFENNSVVVSKEKHIVFQATCNDRVYSVKFKLKGESVAQKACTLKANQCNILWHRRLGHPSNEKMKQLQREQYINISGSDGKDIICEICVKSKQTRGRFQKYNVKTNRPLELVHTDVCGPINPATYNGKKYILTFLDDYTHFTMVYLMETKNEVKTYFKQYVEQVSAKFNCKISRIRCDNGKEYENKEVSDYCKEKGIKVEVTIPYTPEENGKAERLNRTIIEKARTLISEANFEKVMWGESVLTAVYLINRLPTVDNKIPAELWYGHKPNYEKLKVFGSVAYLHVPKEKRTKLDDKSVKCRLLGFCDNGYRLWNPNEQSVIRGRDVIFDEDEESIKKQVLDITGNESEQDQEDGEQEGDIENQGSEEVDIMSMTEQSVRKRKIPVWHKDYDFAHMAYFEGEDMIEEEPKTKAEAMMRKDKGKWSKAFDEELESHDKYQTWTVVPRTKNMKVIDSKWVLKIKKDGNGNIERYKARLVAKGYQLTEYSDTYSPVAKINTFRILLSVANKMDYEVDQMDVKTAFLNGTINKEIYMDLPEELYSEKFVCKLNKSIYGLKQSPKCWNEKFNDFMKQEQFKNSLYDTCLYVKNSSNVIIYVLLYVDDIIIVGNNLEEIQKFKSQLCSVFEMVDLGQVKYFLGLSIERNREERVFKIHQSQYTQEILKRFHMESCNGISTPIEKDLFLKKAELEGEKTSKPYRQLIGSLMYLMIGSRPDISFSLNYFSRFQDKATDECYSHLKRILRYLKQNNYQLVFTDCDKKDEKEIACGYVDADWGSDKEDRKSITGYCFYVFGNLVTWRTKKQATVSLSSTEAEYCALSQVACDALWIIGILQDLGFIEFSCITLFEDNQSTIHLANNRENGKRTKHIDIKHHFIRDHIEKGNICVKYVPSNQQIADMFTKGLTNVMFKKFCNDLGLEKLELFPTDCV